jgi:hypothetical protein
MVKVGDLSYLNLQEFLTMFKKGFATKSMLNLERWSSVYLIIRNWNFEDQIWNLNKVSGYFFSVVKAYF